MFAWLEEVEPHEKDFSEFKETGRIEQIESPEPESISLISSFFLSSTFLGEEADLFLHVIPQIEIPPTCIKGRLRRAQRKQAGS